MMQGDLNVSVIWANIWHLCTSLQNFCSTTSQKTHFMFTMLLIPDIAVVDTIKDLCIHMTNVLLQSKHVTEVINEVNSICNVILHSFASPTVKLCLRAFQLCIKPILSC